MQQQWLLLLASINTNRVIKDDTQSPERTPPEPSSPWPTDTTMANEALCHPLECPVTFEPHSLIHQSQSLLDEMKKQSQALRNLTVLSDKLLSLMTCVVSEVDKLVAVQPPHMILVPSTPPLPMTNTTITLLPAPGKKPLLPSTRNPNNLHTATSSRPPRPPALFPKTIQITKPHTRMKMATAKPSVVRGCYGTSWTKDNLRPP